MEDFITNILVGVRTWVNGKLEDITYVISSHINALTSRMDTAETKLTGIETGAEVNVIEAVKVDGTALTPDANKTVNIDLSGKVDKVNGKGLSTEDFTTAYMTKLDALPADAAANVIEAITVNGNPVTVTNKTAAITVQTGSTITVDSNDDILALSNENVLSSTLSLQYDSENRQIQLFGKDSNVPFTYIPADDFVKDGMLDKTAIYTYTATGWEKTSGEDITIPGTQAATVGHEYLVFQWNSDEESKVNVLDASSLMDIYTGSTGITVNSAHQISLKVAGTDSAIGGVKPGDNVTVASDGTLTVSYASASVAGAVKVGTGLSIDTDGVLSATGGSISYADKTTYGIVKIGDGIDVADGVIGVAKSDTYTYGLVKAGDGLTCVDGVISVTYVSVAQVLAVLSAEDSPAA